MNPLVPVVRYMVVCEKVMRDDTKVHSTSLVGLINRLVSEGSFPRVFSDFSAFLQITGCRGPGRGRVEIDHPESGEMVFWTKNTSLSFSSDPLVLQGLTVNVRGCSFPEPGWYDVQFWYNDVMLAEQPILVK